MYFYPTESSIVHENVFLDTEMTFSTQIQRFFQSFDPILDMPHNKICIRTISRCAHEMSANRLRYQFSLITLGFRSSKWEEKAFSKWPINVSNFY